MVDIIKYGSFNLPFSKRKKTQILLTHTYRNLSKYLIGLKYRYYGEYKKIPNYIVSEDGKILKLLEDEQYSEFIDNNPVNEKLIIICLENLGWLQKQPLNNNYVNWIGDIYNGDVFERKWRDYFFWHPYSEKQIDVTSYLCKTVLEKSTIPKKIIEHNTKIMGIENFEGVAYRSNYSKDYTDVNPSFNFEKFIKNIKDE